MEKSEIVSREIYNELFESYLPDRLRELESANAKDIDQSVSDVFKLFQNSSEIQRSAIRSYLELIVTDVASTILGGIDDVTDLGSLSGEFEMTYEGETINGSLQDYFLRKVQEEHSK
jgi:hypothetical protein